MPGVARLGARKRKDKVLGKKITCEQVEEVAELGDGFQEAILVDNASAKSAEIAVNKSAKYWE